MDIKELKEALERTAIKVTPPKYILLDVKKELMGLTNYNKPWIKDE